VIDVGSGSRDGSVVQHLDALGPSLFQVGTDELLAHRALIPDLGGRRVIERTEQCAADLAVLGTHRVIPLLTPSQALRPSGCTWDAPLVLAQSRHVVLPPTVDRCYRALSGFPSVGPAGSRCSRRFGASTSR